VFYYFHAASQQSVWEKPNAPFVPYSPDEDEDDEDDSSESESDDNGQNSDGAGGSNGIASKLSTDSTVAEASGDTQVAGAAAPLPSMAWIPSAVDERQCRALLGELMYNEDEVGVLILLESTLFFVIFNVFTIFQM